MHIMLKNNACFLLQRYLLKGDAEMQDWSDKCLGLDSRGMLWTFITKPDVFLVPHPYQKLLSNNYKRSSSLVAITVIYAKIN